MTPEDVRLWKLVTEGIIPLNFPVSAAAIRPSARPVLQNPAPTVLDLHGLTLQAAHAAVRRFVSQARHNGMRHVVVITGLSGGIRREFPHWVEQLPEVRRSETLNGGGAFRLHFARRRA